MDVTNFIELEKASAQDEPITITLNARIVNRLVRYWDAQREYERLLGHRDPVDATIGRMLDRTIRTAMSATTLDIIREREAAA